jgi:Mor family transcriptional regulator
MNNELELIQEFFRVMPKEINGIALKDVLRFFNSIDIEREEDCWEWRTALTSGGYGAFRTEYKTIVASRFSWEIYFDKIPEGIYVCHKCDNRKCVNPNHLFLGTPKDNMQDMIKKGRHNPVRREKHSRHTAKLNEDQVLEIKLMGKKQSATRLAKKYGVSTYTIYSIRKGLTWRHLDEKILNKKIYYKTLTEDEILKIKDACNKQDATKLAKQYGVSTRTIYRIKSGETWKNVK